MFPRMLNPRTRIPRLVTSSNASCREKLSNSIHLIPPTPQKKLQIFARKPNMPITRPPKTLVASSSRKACLAVLSSSRVVQSSSRATTKRVRETATVRRNKKPLKADSKTTSRNPATSLHRAPSQSHPKSHSQPQERALKSLVRASQLFLRSNLNT